MRRICSFFSDYIYYASILSYRLQKRGYDKVLIDKAFMMVADLDRNKLFHNCLWPMSTADSVVNCVLF